MSERDNDRVFNLCRRTLICVFLTVRIMKSAVVFNFIGESNLLLYILTGLSLVLFAWDVFTKRRIFKGRYVVWLIGFIAVCVISSIINIRYGFAKNVYIIVFIAVHTLLLYSSVSTQGIERIKKDINVYGHLIMVLFTILVVVMDAMYLMNFQYTLVGDKLNDVISQGYLVESGRAWGVFEYPAIMIISVAVIAFCIYFIYTYKNILARIAYSLVILINFIAIILCGARAAQYAMYVFLFVLPILVLKRKTDKIDAKAFFKKLAVSFILLAVTFCLTIGFQMVLPHVQSAVCSSISGKSYYKMMCGIKNIYKLSGYETTFTNAVEYLDPETGVMTVALDDIDIDRFERYGIGSSGDITSGRMPLWKDGVSMFFDVPVLGTSPGNMQEYAENNFPEASIVEHKMELHNSYLDILVKTGALGFAAMGGFLILTAVYIAKYYRRRHKNMRMVGCFLSVVIAMLVYMLVESDSFTIIRIQANVFWLLLGIITAIINSDVDEEQKQKAPVIDTSSDKGVV